MMEERRTFRAYMKAAGEEFEGPKIPCLSEAELVEYHRGACDESRRGRIQSHLVACKHCCGVLLDVSQFFDPPRDQESVPSSTEVGEDWTRLKARIAVPRLQRSRAPVWLPVAAGVVLAIALGWTLQDLRRSENRILQLSARLDAAEKSLTSQVAESRRPRLDASIHDVFSTEFLQRSGGSGQANAIEAAAAAPVTLILNGAGQARHTSYAIEIVDGEGQTVWRAEGLPRGSQGSYVITLPGDFLKPGDYRFRVLGQTSAGYRELSQYPVSWKTK